jgi:NADH-quinone oxidoreductase subunit J
VTYDIVFIVASVVAISAALTVVLASNPFISALSLIANLIALATFYLLLQSDFLAAAQVIVYAGAVMIMFLFVTAYLGGKADEPTRGERPVWQTLAALIAAAGITAEIVFGVDRQSFLHGPVVSDAFGAPQAIAAVFLGRYLLAFEGTSVLLLIAAVGGVTLATRRAAPRGPDEPGAFEVERPEHVRSLQSSVMAVETQFEVVHTGAAADADAEKADG